MSTNNNLYKITTDTHGGLNCLIHIDYSSTVIKVLHMMGDKKWEILKPYKWDGKYYSESDVNFEITTDSHGGINAFVLTEVRSGKLKVMYMMEKDRNWTEYPSALN
ncbi:MAG: hypothetical protein COA79_14325 [Planctomycetota bacterium]|nr:MAG: hypothetical protein COA79_14325 [Planctomycetota bacterium]